MAYGKCPKCNTAYGKSSHFCKACGYNLTEPAEPSSSIGTEPEPKPSGEALLGEAVDQLEAGMDAEAEVVSGEKAEPAAPPDAPLAVASAPVPDTPPAEAASPKEAVLEVVNGLAAGAQLRVEAGRPVSIGAGDKADLKIPGDDLISRNHAAFFLKDGKLVVRDEGSTNGTLLKVNACKALEDGDVLILGGTVVRVTWEG